MTMNGPFISIWTVEGIRFEMHSKTTESDKAETEKDPSEDDQQPVPIFLQQKVAHSALWY